LFAASNSGRLFALDAKTGAILWRRDLKARVNASLAFLDKTLYAGTLDGLYAIDPESGSIKKRISVGGFVYGTLVVVPPRMLLMLVKAEQAKLAAFDTVTRKIRWEQKTRSEWSTFKPLVSGQMVIAGNEEKELCAFALTDGVPRWCRSIGRVPRGLGMSGDGILYVGTLDGRVLGYHLQ
jgi:outer membrane protein assembly factor BamB